MSASNALFVSPLFPSVIFAPILWLCICCVFQSDAKISFLAGGFCRSLFSSGWVREGGHRRLFVMCWGQVGVLTRCGHFYTTHFLTTAILRPFPRSTFFISWLLCLWSSGFYGLIRCFCKKTNKWINETKTNFRGIADRFVRIYNTLLYTFQSKYLLLINRGPPFSPPPSRLCLWTDDLPVFRHDIWVVLFVCQWYPYLYDYDIHDCCLPQPTM